MSFRRAWEEGARAWPRERLARTLLYTVHHLHPAPAEAGPSVCGVFV